MRWALCWGAEERGKLWICIYWLVVLCGYLSIHSITVPAAPQIRWWENKLLIGMSVHFYFFFMYHNWGVMLVAESRGLFWKPVLFGFCLLFLQQNTDFKLTTWMQKSIAWRWPLQKAVDVAQGLESYPSDLGGHVPGNKLGLSAIQRDWDLASWHCLHPA